ncbi:MAG: hypothetical protein H6619_02710 [Deltaproteobacteria bacterium]|nr:hypothetical protein [Deltaproteobacteria bacterium]
MDVKGFIKAYQIAVDVAEKLKKREGELKQAEKNLEARPLPTQKKDLNPHKFEFTDTRFKELLDEKSFQKLYDKHSKQEKKEPSKPALRIKTTSNHLLPIRAVKHKSSDSIRAATHIWNYLFLSLPLDVALFYLLKNYFDVTFINAKGCEYIFIMLLIVAGIFASFKNYTLTYLMLKNLQRKFINIKNSKYYLPAALLLAMLPILHLFVQALSLKNLGMILLGVIVVSTGMYGNYKQVKQDQKKHLNQNSDKVNWLEQINREIYIISLIPIVASRLISLIGVAIVLSTQSNSAQYAVYLTTAILLLYYFRPRTELYVMHCKRCSVWTSIALYYEGFCPVCMREEFTVKEKDLTTKVDELEPIAAQQ